MSRQSIHQVLAGSRGWHAKAVHGVNGELDQAPSSTHAGFYEAGSAHLARDRVARRVHLR